MGTTRRDIQIAALFAVLGIFLSLILLEIGVRLIPGKGKARPPGDRPRTYYLPPGATSMRGNVFEVAKPPGTIRIGVVGDSFTYGPDMHFFDAFPARLERLMRLNLHSLPVEVINYGTPGYSTHHEVDTVRNALDAGCDLVILEITLNDAQPEPLRRNPFRSLLHGSILSESRLLTFVSGRIESYRSKQRYIDYHYDIFADPANKAVFEGAIRDMKSLTEARGVPLIAAIFPLFDFPIDEKYPFAALHDQVRKTLKQNRIPALDLTSAYRGMDVKRLQLTPGADSHPNEIGHRIAADAIYDWLRGSRLLPREIFAVRAYRARDNIVERQIRLNEGNGNPRRRRRNGKEHHKD